MEGPLKRACRPLSFMGIADCSRHTSSQRAFANALGTIQTGLARGAERTVISFRRRAAAVRVSGLIRRPGPPASAPTAASAPCASGALQEASQRSGMQRLLLSEEQATMAHTKHHTTLACSLAAQHSMQQVGLMMQRSLQCKEGLTSGCTAPMEDTAALWTYLQTCRQKTHLRLTQGSQSTYRRCPVAKVLLQDHLTLGHWRCACAACSYGRLPILAL